MFQVFVKDVCTNRGGTYKIEIKETMTMDEFKKKVFEKTQVPSQSQKFRFNTKYLNHEEAIFNQIDFQYENWVTIELAFRWHGPGCGCFNCVNTIILRNGKRVNRI
jgi:hypothetical protein